jgi:cation diffusion facilitator family transporter
MATDHLHHADKEKQGAASSSVFAAALLTLLKLVVGMLTGSLGILSEAAHSGLDLVAALVTFFAVRISDQPPDEEHQYGHGKVENLSALVETLLLLATCVWIFYEVIQRLFFKTVEVEATVWAFLVMVISVVVDINRSRMLYRVARKYNSQALEADALHFSTDIWSSLTVIAGLGLVRLSDYLGPEWAWLEKADAVAALVVAIIVVYVSVQLGKRAVAVLLDTAPPGLADRIRAEVVRLPGVQVVGPVRIRQSGASTFIDLAAGTARSISLEEAHEIAEAVENRVTELSPQSDVVVHVEPVQQVGESLPQTVSAIAGRLGLQAHNIHAHEVMGEYFVSLDVEVPDALTLGEAHEQASRLEKALYHEMPHVKQVNTHIEPITASTTPIISHPVLPQDSPELESLKSQILALIGKVPELQGCHNLHIWLDIEGYDVLVHCLADPDLPITEAHKLAERLENQLHAQVEGIHQVTVHMEPHEPEPDQES